jgi:hypothetical protein
MFTPDRQSRIIEAITAGNYNEVAARYAGISEKTFYNWLARGEAGEDGYVQFLQSVKNAQAQAEVRDVALIARAAETNWQAAAWKLERKYYQRWGRKDRMMLEGGDPEHPIRTETKLDLSVLTDEELSLLEGITGKVLGVPSGTEPDDTLDASTN